LRRTALAGASLFVVAAAVVAAAVVAAVLFVGNGGRPGSATTLLPTATPVPVTPTATPYPRTWKEGIEHATGDPILLSCFDGNRDGRLSAADGPTFSGVNIPLVPGEACIDPAHHRDFYPGTQLASGSSTCALAQPPLLLVGIASAGSDMFDTAGGESMGMLQIVNDLQTRAAGERIATEVVLSTAAVFGADRPQTHMEQWLAQYIRRRLDALPCMRAVLLGHSHGAVNVTSITAALDDGYGDRMFGVAIDRTVALYDRNATEYPARAEIFNVFQLNEGWHGSNIDLPNVVNYDASLERAPIALSDGGGAQALISHKTLDDSPGIQRRIEDAIMAWLAQHR
jgi:hypothetical protein